MVRPFLTVTLAGNFEYLRGGKLAVLLRRRHRPPRFGPLVVGIDVMLLLRRSFVLMSVEIVESGFVGRGQGEKTWGIFVLGRKTGYVVEWLVLHGVLQLSAPWELGRT
jgi:hypothetical protein